MDNSYSQTPDMMSLLAGRQAGSAMAGQLPSGSNPPGTPQITDPYAPEMHAIVDQINELADKVKQSGDAEDAYQIAECAQKLAKVANQRKKDLISMAQDKLEQ